MKKILSWDEYVKQRETESVNESAEVEAPEELAIGGEPMDATYRNVEEYKKLLDFLKGKGNVVQPPQPPAEAAKGWFVVDEQTRGFWTDNGWSNDPNLLTSAVIDSEKAAQSLAKVINGTVIPAQELLGN